MHPELGCVMTGREARGTLRSALKMVGFDVATLSLEQLKVVADRVLMVSDRSGVGMRSYVFLMSHKAGLRQLERRRETIAHTGRRPS